MESTDQNEDQQTIPMIDASRMEEKGSSSGSSSHEKKSKVRHVAKLQVKKVSISNLKKLLKISWAITKNRYLEAMVLSGLAFGSLFLFSPGDFIPDIFEVLAFLFFVPGTFKMIEGWVNDEEVEYEVFLESFTEENFKRLVPAIVISAVLLILNSYLVNHLSHRFLDHSFFSMIKKDVYWYALPAIGNAIAYSIMGAGVLTAIYGLDFKKSLRLIQRALLKSPTLALLLILAMLAYSVLAGELFGLVILFALGPASLPFHYFLVKFAFEDIDLDQLETKFVFNNESESESQKSQVSISED